LAGEIEALAREMMAAFDRQEYARMKDFFTDDAQGVDEVSRKWMRGSADMDAYFTQFGAMMSAISSEMSDVHEQVLGVAGVFTCWMEQDYTMQGEAQHFSGPMTMVMRREAGGWKICLVHAVPMPPAE
jgi:ketosteroid isomerase-like protein